MKYSTGKLINYQNNTFTDLQLLQRTVFQSLHQKFQREQFIRNLKNLKISYTQNVSNFLKIKESLFA